MRLNSSKGGLAGILIIALVLSTLIVLSLRHEEAGSPVFIARNEYPALFRSTESRGETMIFNFGIICKEPFKELEIRYANLFMQHEPQFTSPTFVPNESDPATIMESRKDIQEIMDTLGDVTIPFDKIDVSVKIGNTTHSARYRGVVYDFSRTLGLFVEPSILDQISEVYAVLMSDDGDILYFSGTPDFFYRRSENIKYLSIRHNENETAFQAVSEIITDTTPIDEAPRVGAVILKNTGKDDQVLIQVNVESTLRTMPEVIEQPAYRKHMVEYIRVYANGKLEASEFSVIPIEMEGWKV